MTVEWHKGWHISKSFFGWWYQHPAYDPENVMDWRYGYAVTNADAVIEIDHLLADDAEWAAARDLVRAMSKGD